MPSIGAQILTIFPYDTPILPLFSTTCHHIGRFPLVYRFLKNKTKPIAPRSLSTFPWMISTPAAPAIQDHLDTQAFFPSGTATRNMRNITCQHVNLALKPLDFPSSCRIRWPFIFPSRPNSPLVFVPNALQHFYLIFDPLWSLSWKKIDL